MKNGYTTLKDYEHWSVESVATDLHQYNYPIIEGFQQDLTQRSQKKRKKKRGMGIDCLRVELDSLVADPRQKEQVECQIYQPSDPYLYQFSSLFAKYPFGPDYHVVDPEGYGKNYLDYYSYIDDNAKIKYTQ